MARALSKAGGLARQAAQSVSPSSCTAKGKPQQTHPGPSKKVMRPQQAAHKPVSPTAPRQPMQSGGNKRSSSALTTFAPMIVSLKQMTDLPNDRGRPPLF